MTVRHGSGEPPDALCEGCGDPIDSEDVSVEAFEMTGELLCADCAEGAFADLEGAHD